MSSVCISAKSKAINTMTFALVVLLANVTLVASYAFYNSNPDAMVRSIRTELSSISEPLLYDLSHETNSHGKQPPIRTLHHISLPPKDDSYSSSAEALVRECWKWKDSVLGDGRDYFVPRPKTLMAFHSLFVGMEICVYTDIVHDAIADSELELVLNRVSLQPQSTNNKTAPSLEIPMLQKDLSVAKQSDSSRCITKRFVIEECVALSNCARFEILLVLKEEEEQQHRTNDAIKENISLVRETAARISVAYHLWRQTRSHKSRSDSLFQRSGLTSWLDLPDSIDLSIFNPISIDQSIDIVQLAQKFTSIEGARSISNHISLIAGGLAPRTNRPDRDVIFRPYSSRDAHILLQLKRTAEVVSTLNVVEIQGGRGRIKILLDCALSAGKAARNERIVPDIRQLKQFGSDGTPPIGLANAVAKVGYSFIYGLLCIDISLTIYHHRLPLR